MDDFTWLSGGKGLLWSSERDGWRHAYYVSRDGGETRLLTPGEYDVMSADGVDEKEGWLYITASPDDPTKRFGYRVRIGDGGAPERIGPAGQTGSHQYAVSPSARWAFHSYSTLDMPTVTELVRLPGGEVVRTLEANKALRAAVEGLRRNRVEFSRLDIGGGVQVDAWRILPPGFDPSRKYPLFVYVYGEPAGQTVLDQWGGNRYLTTGLAVAAAPAVLTSLASCRNSQTAAADALERTISRKFRRVELAFLPTPLQRLKSLAEELRFPDLLIKRDDNTGLAFGGNKSRKLEYIVGDALDKKCDVLVTWAGVQSNWCRQTAAAARVFGMKAVLLLQKTDTAAPPYDGNLLLDRLLGAEIRFLEPGEDRAKLVDQIVQDENSRGRRPYVVSVGGLRTGGSMTAPLGAIGYAKDFVELQGQTEHGGIKIGHVVVATGSAGTQAGLVVGAKALGDRTKIVGISVSGDKKSIQKNVAEIANATAAALELQMTFSPEEVIVFDDYVGGGYGILNQPTADAIVRVARGEGILLDPVYTGKAMAGMLDLLHKGYFKSGERVVFMHTGGTPALFPHKDGLLSMLSGG